MKRKRESPPRNESSRNREKREGHSRRTLLAALGAGALLPALRADGGDGADAEKVFDEYWAKVEDDIKARDAEKDIKKRERLELAIQYRRNAVMKTIDRSQFNRMCLAATPTPTSAK